jgi:glutamine synthetase
MNSNNIDITKGTLIAEYVWPDLNGNLRSKIKIIQKQYFHSFTKVEDFPIWNFDGSSTGQSLTTVSDVIIRPVRLYKNPLINSDFQSVLVLCECLNKDLSPHETNSRTKCEETSNKFKDYECLFGIEQEYTILERDGKPYKWLNCLEPGLGAQGPYYCSVGGDRAFGREIVDEHMLCCLNAGIHICGTNAEVMPSQWEFQIGTCDMLTVSDDLLVARFFLHKITEKYNCCVSFHPKLFPNWNGSGGHTNFSTKQMREKNGFTYITEACEKLAEKHDEHIAVYGIDNDKRLTGNHETSDIHTFSWDKQNRNCSIRIPLQVCIDNFGYLEDRRPASNMDPYLVTEIMVKTICSE